MDAVKRFVTNAYRKGLSLESQKYILLILTLLILFAVGAYRGYRIEEHFGGSVTQEIE